MKRLRVAVLMGGTSAEREVSEKSGKTAVEALTSAGAVVQQVDVRDANFCLRPDIDVAFLALHGTFGEDGQIQRILDGRGVAYTGSDAEASERAFDKSIAKEFFKSAGIPTPPYHALERDIRLPAEFKLPVVIKPARQGSSFGITLVKDRAALERAVEQAWRYDDRLVVESYIKGREFTVGVLGDRALPVVEIKTHHEFFDYDAKYVTGLAEEVVPANIDSRLATRMQDLALHAHRCLGCRDISRTDIMMNSAGDLFVLEVNTLPGMTPNSLLPKAAAAAGLTMRDVCTRLVEAALARRLEAVAA